MSGACPSGIAWDDLAAYWFGETGEHSLQLEDHAYGCPLCVQRLGQIAAIGEGLRAHARSGMLHGATTPAVLDRLVADGLHLRRYATGPGGTVHCTAAPEDDLVTVALALPPHAFNRVDAVFRSDVTRLNARFEDVPITGGTLHWVETGRFLRTLDDDRLLITLVGVATGREEELATFTLQHSKWQGTD